MPDIRVATLYLPQSEAVAAELTASTTFDADPGGRETILVVEDDEDLRDVAVEMIEELGYRVVTASNGPEALARLKAEEPVDLLFSDIVMPGGISGLALATQARQMRRRLGVLLTTGYPAEDRTDLARSALPVIHKPYRRDKLAQMLRVALDLRRAE